MHWVTPVSPGLAFLSLMTGIHYMVDVLLKVSVNTNDHLYSYHLTKENTSNNTMQNIHHQTFINYTNF
jgi:hypothetical protein